MTADENTKISPIKEEVANGEVIETVQATSPKATELNASPSSFEEAKPPVLPKDEFTPSPLSRSRPALPRKSSKRSPPQLPRRRASSLKSEGSAEERLRSIDEPKIIPTTAENVSPEVANPSVISTTGDLPILQELTSNNSSNSVASGNTLSVPETNARKSLDNMSRTSFSQEFISQLSELECGTDPILERNRLSVNTIRLISKFLKRKAFLEEEHAKQVSKTIQQTLKEMEKEEVYEGAFTIGFRQILEYHDKLARNRLKFSLDTNHIADELNNISKDKERTRKALKEQQIRDHKRLVDAEIGLEKSYNRYINTSDAWDQSVILKHNGGRISPDGGGHSTILNHVPKQVATTFGLFNKPKSLDQLIKQEEECKARAMISKDQYSIQLFHLNSVKKEYYQKLLPALIRDSLDNINQCDYWAQFYLSTYSHNYQALLQQEVDLMGSSPDGLDGAITKIQPIEDTQVFLNSLLTKYKSINMDPIQMQEYQHSSAAQTALSSRAIFGVDLRGQLARDRVKVPIIITKCAEFIEKIGIEFEGIYRVSGATTKIQKLKSLFDHDASKVDLDKIDYAYDISNVAGVLKLYLRELPEPLIPVSILEQFMPLMPIEGDDPPQLQKFQTLLVQLPIYSYETIKYLILHLTKVMAHSNVNKMTASNLAIVFGPTLFSPPSQDNSDAVSNMTSQCQATLIMIKYSDKLFERSPTLPERSVVVPDHLGKLKYQSFDEQSTSGLKISPTEFVVNKDGSNEKVQSPDEEIDEIPLVISGPVLPNTLDNGFERISLDLPSTSNNEQLVDSNQQLKKEDNANEPLHD